MKTIVYLVVIFSFAGSFEIEKTHFNSCTETGKEVFRKPYGTISYEEKNKVGNCCWIFERPGDVKEYFFLSLDIFFYSKILSSDSLLLPNGFELNSSNIEWDRGNALRLTFYKSKSLINKSPLHDCIKRPANLLETNRWPPRIVTNVTDKFGKGIRFGLFYSWRFYYPLLNCSSKNETSGNSGDHINEEQDHQQLMVGAVVALAVLLTAAIITVFLLLIKLRQLKNIQPHPASNINEIPLQQRVVLEESSFENSFSTSDENSERQMAENLSLPPVHAH